ncbi:hypothetical protein FrEUN1fDRAFT_2670 [Parafrankia sp. EUN1f]|nr:hypothetical protein FrEUN1fDRAFT_2670 [Parafrankia sp. EUN1f]
MTGDHQMLLVVGPFPNGVNVAGATDNSSLRGTDPSRVTGSRARRLRCIQTRKRTGKRRT